MARVASVTALLVLATLGTPAGVALAAPADPLGSVRQAELDPGELEDEVGDEEEVVDIDLDDPGETVEDTLDVVVDDPAEDGGSEDSPVASGPSGQASAKRTARTRDTVMRSLRRRGLRALSTSFAAPGKGRVTVTVTSGGRRLMEASRSTRGGRVTLRVKPTAMGAKATRARKHPKVTVTVRWQPAGGRPETSTGRVKI